jgi:hypothetical protein
MAGALRLELMMIDTARTVFFKNAAGEVHPVRLPAVDAVLVCHRHPWEWSLDGKTFARLLRAMRSRQAKAAGCMISQASERRGPTDTSSSRCQMSEKRPPRLGMARRSPAGRISSAFPSPQARHHRATRPERQRCASISRRLFASRPRTRARPPSPAHRQPCARKRKRASAASHRRV